MRKTVLLFACAILCSSFAGAQPTESACDGEQGAAYGLCNAFCEAMECDSDDPQASETACNKVKGKFQQITGHEPPCLTPAVTCPCIEELPGFLAIANATVTNCYDGLALGPNHVLRLVTSEGDVYVTTDPNQRSCGIPSTPAVFITPEENQACIGFLRAKAAAASVPCVIVEDSY